MERTKEIMDCIERCINTKGVRQPCLKCRFLKEENCVDRLLEEALPAMKAQEGALRGVRSRLYGVMYFIDKFLDEEEKKEKDEVCRAAIMRNKLKTLLEEKDLEIERLNEFKTYFDELYGQGLEVENFHLNDDTESFDNFYEDALNRAHLSDKYPKNIKRQSTTKEEKVLIDKNKLLKEIEDKTANIFKEIKSDSITELWLSGVYDFSTLISQIIKDMPEE